MTLKNQEPKILTSRQRDVRMLIEDFNRTIDIWIKELDQYNFKQICAKPSLTSWSLGQVYIHLIEETKYYIEQIKICLSSNENLIEEASPDAKTMFLNNDFPDQQIEGAATNSLIPYQTKSGMSLYREF